MIMGCYGLGIGRTVAAAIEQNHDEDGIIWPLPLAPFQVLLVSLNPKDEAVRSAADELYDELVGAGRRGPLRRPRRAARRQVQGRRPDRHPGPSGGRRQEPGEGKVELSLRRDREKHAVAVGDALGRVVELVRAG